MKCRFCGCTDTQACEGGCWWAEPELCSTCADRMPTLEPGQQWRDATGNARVQFTGNVTREGAWAVLQRCSGTTRKRHKPFLYSIGALLRGDDGWQHVPER
jgi:hypothetical protein